jgi:hypothetical protein
MNRQIEKLMEQINDWFYYSADELSPAHSVCFISSIFAERIEKAKYRLCIPFKDFRDKLCEATCVMYMAHVKSKTLRGPTKIYNLPKNWNADIENIWEDYLCTFILHDDFWTDFWHAIPYSIWEVQFPIYRYFIQSILTYYIQRDYEHLEENNLIKQTDDGDYVDINEYDEDDIGYASE